MDSKKWYKSKTVWASVLEIAGGIATAAAGQIATGGALTAAGIIGIILRSMTASGIAK